MTRNSPSSWFGPRYYTSRHHSREGRLPLDGLATAGAVGLLAHGRSPRVRARILIRGPGLWVSADVARMTGGVVSSMGRVSRGRPEPVSSLAADELVALAVGRGLWQRVFMVAPLVLVGTREVDGGYDFAPKHMAMPLGSEGFYCFVCSPRHATYANVAARPEFTVSFPRPEQILETSFAAGARTESGAKPTLAALPTIPARAVEGRLVAGCELYLECELERLVDGFGPNSLVIGRVVAAAAARDALRDVDVDDADLVHRLGLLGYLSPGRFAVVRESLSFPYPVDYRR